MPQIDLEAEIEALKSRIGALEQKPVVSAADVAGHEARIAGLEGFMHTALTAMKVLLHDGK